GYTAAGVRRAADDLVAAGVLSSTQQQPVAYRTNRRAWIDLLSLDSAAPVWLNWRHRFTVVATFNSWAKSASSRPLSTYAFGVRGSEIVEKYPKVFRALAPFSFDDATHRDGPVTFVRENLQLLASRMIEGA
ncbi:MAG: hypothetical protein ACRD3J_07740, partial [Thermoanaerobaculia bacterium]